MVLAAIAAVALTANVNLNGGQDGSLPLTAVFSEVRQQVLTLQKDLNNATRIQQVSREVRQDLWTAQRLRNDMQRLRHRRPGDPFLRHDLQRLVWDLRDLNRSLYRAQAEIIRLSRQVEQNPEYVAPAEGLDRAARDLRSETRWLETDGRWLASDLRRNRDLQHEAWDVERETRETDRYAREIEWEARALLTKVR